jgi:hypothetical protein
MRWRFMESSHDKSPNNSPEPPPSDAVSPHSRLTDWVARLSFCR